MATRFALSSATVPVGLVQGAAQLITKLAGPVMGPTASLNAAVISVLLTATPVALTAGATAVTVGGRGGVSKPRMGSLPPPPPQAARAPTNIAASHGLMVLCSLFIDSSCGGGTGRIPRERPLQSVRMGPAAPHLCALAYGWGSSARPPTAESRCCDGPSQVRGGHYRSGA